MLRGVKLLFFLLMFIKDYAIIDAKTFAVPRCVDSPSCGNIHNISYPFWLEGHSEQCGEPKYKLFCDANNKTVMYLDSVKYFVQSIDRKNFTIRLVDAFVEKDNCSSLPLSSVTDWNLTLSFEQDSSTYEIIYLSCLTPLSNSSLFIDTRPCVNESVMAAKKSGKYYSYVTFGQAAKISDLGDSCSIDLVTMSAKPITCGLNCSYSEIHDLIAYGFELSWKFIDCQKNCPGQPLALALAQGDPGQDHSCFMKDDANIYCNRCNSICFVRFVLFTIVASFTAHFLLKFVIGVLPVSAFLIYKWRRRHLSMYDNVEEFLRNQNNLRPITYSFSEIKTMTKCFKEKLGEGGFGLVYKGMLQSGRDVAVKVLGKSEANGQDFINEVGTIGRIHHVNVVRLIGFCAERSKRALVYEFMSNGSLEKHIFRRGQENAMLSYEKMWEISLGVARGIEYLHRGCDMSILHFDIKPHNILLDENFTPKVSDFGLAKLYPTNGRIASLTTARGTIGYIAPELLYRNLGAVSYKADVYSFGMLLLEMMGKRRALSANEERSSQIYFPSWVHDQISKGKCLEVDHQPAEEEIELVRKMIMIGLWCIQTRPNDRPSMNRVIEMLESDVESLEMPPKPSLCIDMTIEVGEHETSLVSSSVLSGDHSMESSSLILNSN